MEDFEEQERRKMQRDLWALVGIVLFILTAIVVSCIKNKSGVM